MAAVTWDSDGFGSPQSHRSRIVRNTITFQSIGHCFDRNVGREAPASDRASLEALLHDTIPTWSADDPELCEYPFRLASHLRQRFGDRQAARLLLVRLAVCDVYDGYESRWIPQILTSPTELALFLRDCQRYSGGWTRKGQLGDAGHHLRSVIKRSLKQLWQEYTPEALQQVSGRSRRTLRDFARLSRIKARTAEEHAFLRGKEGQGATGDGATPTRGVLVPVGDLGTGGTSPEEVLRDLPELLAAGWSWDQLQPRIGRPAYWGPEIWPVHLFSAYLRLAALLPQHHPLSLETSSRNSAIPISTIESACYWLDEAFHEQALQTAAPIGSRPGFVLFDNSPDYRQLTCAPGRWSYRIAALSLAGALLTGGHASTMWLLHPHWRCVVDAPMTQPLVQLSRLMDYGARRGKQRLLRQVSFPPDFEAECYCWISPQPWPHAELLRAFGGRFHQCWLAPGHHAEAPDPENQASFIGLSPAVFESMQALLQEGYPWPDYIQENPVRKRRQQSV